MHHPPDRIAHTTAFVTPVVDHMLEQEIVYGSTMRDRSDDPSNHVCMYIYVCIYVCMFMYVCVYMYVYMYVCVYVCTLRHFERSKTRCMFVCMCV